MGGGTPIGGGSGAGGGSGGGPGGFGTPTGFTPSLLPVKGCGRSPFAMMRKANRSAHHAQFPLEWRKSTLGHLGRYYFEKAARRMWYVTAHQGSALRWPFLLAVLSQHGLALTFPS